MALQPGDVKLTAIKRTLMAMNGNSIPAYELRFTIRGEGDYAVRVPAEGYSLAVAEAAIASVANPILETLDAFK